MSILEGSTLRQLNKSFNEIEFMKIKQKYRNAIVHSDGSIRYYIDDVLDENSIEIFDSITNQIKKNEIKHEVIREYLNAVEQLENSKIKDKPPEGADKLMLTILPKDMREFQLGDLEEEFRTRILPNHGLKYAVRWYWIQAGWAVLFGLRSQLANLIGLGLLTKIASWFVKKGG